MFAWLLGALAAGDKALAAAPLRLQVTIKDHRFQPAEIHLPVGTPYILEIKNEDSTPEEFDSTALKVEKVIPGGMTVQVRLRPLGPGRYPFEGEYHPKTANGVVVADDNPNASSPAHRLP